MRLGRVWRKYNIVGEVGLGGCAAHLFLFFIRLGIFGELSNVSLTLIVDRDDQLHVTQVVVGRDG